MELGTLRVITPDGQVREFPIEDEAVVIGRSAGNGVVIDHVSVSRRHAQLLVTPEKAQIEDLGSANGTFVGSQRLAASTPTELAEGQPLRLGDVEARFYRPATAGISVASATVVSLPMAGSESAQSTLGVALASPSAPVAPGAATTATVVVQNRGQSVDHVTISVPDLPANWLRVSRPQLTLVPGAKDEVTIVLQPPRAAEASAGETPLAVAVHSREHNREVRVLGKFTILPFEAFALSLQPPRGDGSFQVIAENEGNEPLGYTLALNHEGDTLTARLAQEKVELKPGERREVGLKVSPRKKSLFSRTEAQMFEVVARPLRPGAPTATVSGQLAEVQAPLRWWKWPAFGIPALLLLGAVVFGATRLLTGNDGQPVAAAGTTATVTAPATTVNATPTPLVMHNTGNAEVINSAQPACLRVRDKPSLQGTQLGSFCDGTRVKVVSESATADGFIWWSVEGKDGTGKDIKGFAAERSMDGANVFMKPVE